MGAWIYTTHNRALPRLPGLSTPTPALDLPPCSLLPDPGSPLPAPRHRLPAIGHRLPACHCCCCSRHDHNHPTTARPIIQAAISHPTALHLLSPLTCCWPGLGRWNPHLVISAPTSICCPSLDHMVASTVVGAAANHLPEEQLNRMSASR